MFLTIIMDIFSQVFCSIIFIMSRTIPPRIFKFISFHLIEFWELWLINYPLDFTLSFHTINLMDFTLSILWCLNNLCFNFHHNLMWQSKVIGLTSLGINGGEGKWPRIKPKVLIWFCSDSWVTLHLPTCILTPNWPLDLIFSIRYWRVRENLGWERKNTILQL